MPSDSSTPSEVNGLAEALKLQALGWNVLAAPVKGKVPIASWKRWQSEKVSERHVREMFAKPANHFIVTGRVSRLIVLDCDDETALAWWKEKLGKVLDETTAVQTGRGMHFYFRLDEDQVIRGRSSDGGDSGKWDIRGEGQGVVAPPSVHKTGRRYAWVSGRDPASIQAIPPALMAAGIAETGGEGSAARSMLAHLLANVPQEGGRNNWLTQVAGHYAKSIPYQDAYEILVRQAADQLTPTLPEHEITKLVKSIWQAEQAKEGRAAPDLEDGGADAWRANLMEPTEDTGWLVSAGTRVLVQIREKDDQGERWVLALSPWLDCDIHVLGIVGAERDQVYTVELRFPGGVIVEDHLSARAVSDSRTLSAWLASHGASIGPPDTMYPVKMRETTRLLRYLRAQGAESMEAVDALGWHEESAAFITHEGLIRADGPGAFERVRPNPGIRGWAPYQYGHSGREKAQEILREVLTFHDETVASVFGAWWAAVFLKPQIVQQTSQFPFMALEASSESGKTTGFFSLMLQLSGSTAGQSNPTRAALRDSLSAHNNGINWVDDLDDLDDIGELLRNVTVGGSMVKKGEGNHAQVVAKLRAALVISGESLGIQDQKALVDRAIVLDVPSPVDRRSVNGDRPQWDDIVAMRQAYPDLTVYAGSVVELALGQMDLVPKTKELRQGSGRHADTIAIARMGSRILAGMVGGGSAGDKLVDCVDTWATVMYEGYSGKENVLTLKLLPRALRSTGWKRRPEGPVPGQRMVATPVFVEEDGSDSPDEGIVWFSPKLLAEWWEREPPANKRVNQRVESAKALEQQARELGLGGAAGDARKLFRLATGEGVQRYWRADKELSTLLLERSRGSEDGEGDD